nr:Asp-tRNA(Asn)/Glu-tRNA(Gln) amidotransferase subunit GatB [Lachnospiraceae bacterium]
VAYLEKLRLILKYLGVSDCKMQEGSLRADINLSVRKMGDKKFGTRTEMKNMSSFKAIARAVKGEGERQIKVLLNGGRIVQETRRWDENKNTSFAMRSKEDAQDYRYFPEPDLVPLEITPEWLAEIKAHEPELRDAKMLRYQREFGIPEYDAAIITGAKKMADIFEETVALCNKPKEVSNWLMVETMRLLRETETDAEELLLEPKKLASLIMLIDQGAINRTVAKEVFEQIFKENIDPEVYIKKKGLLMVQDDTLLKEAIARVLEVNAQSVADLKSGKDRVFGFLVGQTMKETKGKADPGKVNKLLREALELK